ncbi:MAG: galactose mutarotase [Lachnospiraceae bacterium]|nr:galactose mutarotase [Lachnospiraceae bacterium]
MGYNVFELENKNGMKVKVTDFGANIMEIWAPDKDGKLHDVVMGFDSPEDYKDNSCFFGACIGRMANRINDAKFTLDGKEYKLAVNDGKNNLHTDANTGFHKVKWEGKKDGNSVEFKFVSPDGDGGFPGKLDMKVTYTLTDENGLIIHYEGVSDKKTLINCTNHSYFNLSGDLTSSIHDHELKLYAHQYTPVVAGAIPTGEITKVAGTVFDFTDFREIGKSIDDNEEQLKLVEGYDHNFVLDNLTGTYSKAAEVKCGRSGIKMEVYTDLPCIQFYAGNCITPQTGKGGVKYDKRQALCLETQFAPDAVNQPGFEKPIFDAGQKYDTKTEYRFSVC